MFLRFDIFNKMNGYSNYTYQHDVENNRVKKVDNGETTYYIRLYIKILMGGM